MSLQKQQEEPPEGEQIFFQPNIRKEENNNKSLRLSFSSLGLYKQPIGHMTTESAAAASPTDGSECPWREILFVPAVLAGHVFQQDIPTEGEVNYEQTLHNRIWSWIWCFTKRWSYSLKILLSPPPHHHTAPSSLWELIKHWTAWGQALPQSEKERLLYYPILTVCWINYFIAVCEKK